MSSGTLLLCSTNYSNEQHSGKFVSSNLGLAHSRVHITSEEKGNIFKVLIKEYSKHRVMFGLLWL